MSVIILSLQILFNHNQENCYFNVTLQGVLHCSHSWFMVALSSLVQGERFTATFLIVFIFVSLPTETTNPPGLPMVLKTVILLSNLYHSARNHVIQLVTVLEFVLSFCVFSSLCAYNETSFILCLFLSSNNCIHIQMILKQI